MRNRSTVAAGLIAFTLCGGCVIPSNFQSEDSRRNANKKDLRFLAIGSTTRGDVLRRLGEPDSFHNQQTILLYRSSRDLLTAVGADNSSPMVQKHRYMVLTFDNNGVLLKKERRSDVDWVF